MSCRRVPRNCAYLRHALRHLRQCSGAKFLDVIDGGPKLLPHCVCYCDFRTSGLDKIYHCSQNSTTAAIALQLSCHTHAALSKV